MVRVAAAIATSLVLVPRVAAADAACGTDDVLRGLAPASAQGIRGELARITDGTIATEGGAWDAPITVTLDGSAAAVTFDLGAARTIGALLLQADANDTYRVTGSTDGAPGTFKLLAELPNVVSRGHGLRTRAVQIAPTAVRFLRLGDPNGDGFYSVSELAAYCRPPTPFPPSMRTVDVPLEPAATAAAAPRRQRRPFDPTVLVLFAAAVGLLGLAVRAVRRGAAASKPG